MEIRDPAGVAAGQIAPGVERVLGDDGAESHAEQAPPRGLDVLRGGRPRGRRRARGRDEPDRVARNEALGLAKRGHAGCFAGSTPASSLLSGWGRELIP